MTDSRRNFQAGHVNSADFVPAPIPQGQVLSGDPRAQSCDLSVSRDRGLSMNLWDCTAGRFIWFFNSDELIQVLEGEVRITDESGELTILRAGNTAHFPAGAQTVWEIPRYLKKIAIHRAPSLHARALRKLNALGRRSAGSAQPSELLKRSIASTGVGSTPLSTPR